MVTRYQHLCGVGRGHEWKIRRLDNGMLVLGCRNCGMEKEHVTPVAGTLAAKFVVEKLLLAENDYWPADARDDTLAAMLEAAAELCRLVREARTDSRLVFTPHSATRKGVR